MSHCPPPTESVLDHFPAPLEIVKTEFRELYSQLGATLTCLADGIVGTPGPAGPPGATGANGADGADGAPGTPGEPFIQAPYVTIGNVTDLTNERALTAGTNITITDGGANGLVTISATGGTGAPSPPERSVQFNEAGAFGGDPEFIYYTDEHSVVCGGSGSSITALTFESCQVFGYDTHIADP